MGGLLAQSMLIALLAIPLLASRKRSAVGGLKKAILWYVCFGVVYMLALRFLYPYLS